MGGLEWQLRASPCPGMPFALLCVSSSAEQQRRAAAPSVQAASLEEWPPYTVHCMHVPRMGIPPGPHPARRGGRGEEGAEPLTSRTGIAMHACCFMWHVHRQAVSQAAGTREADVYVVEDDSMGVWDAPANILVRWLWGCMGVSGSCLHVHVCAGVRVLGKGGYSGDFFATLCMWGHLVFFCYLVYVGAVWVASCGLHHPLLTHASTHVPLLPKCRTRRAKSCSRRPARASPPTR